MSWFGKIAFQHFSRYTYQITYLTQRRRKDYKRRDSSGEKYKVVDSIRKETQTIFIRLWFSFYIYIYFFFEKSQVCKCHLLCSPNMINCRFQVVTSYFVTKFSSSHYLSDELLVCYEWVNLSSLDFFTFFTASSPSKNFSLMSQTLKKEKWLARTSLFSSCCAM